MCQYKHKCVDCHGYLHIICGEAYHDSDGNEVEDLGYPRVCDNCALKRRIETKQPDTTQAPADKEPEDATKPPADKGQEESEESNSATETDENSIESDNFFTDEERRAFQPGWYIPLDLKAKELVKNRFRKPRVSEKTKLEGKIV